MHYIHSIGDKNMKCKIIKSELHAKHVKDEAGKSYQIYTSNYTEQMKQFNYICDLLKDVKGDITLKKDKDSWYMYDLEVKYKDFVFKIGSDWKNKLGCRHEEIFKYQNHSIYNEERKKFIEENEPSRYTFYKLTTKKLIGVFDYRIKLFKLLKKLSGEKEETHTKIFNEDIKNLKFIAKHLKTEVKETEDNTSRSVYLYTPFGRIETIYEKYSKQTKHSYEIEKHIEYIKKIKQGA